MAAGKCRIFRRPAPSGGEENEMTNEHFNQLTPAEDERLALLIEECSEVIKIACKIQRHGYESYNPTVLEAERRTNRSLLEEELGDVVFAVRLMYGNSDIDPSDVYHFMEEKREKIQRYLHHNDASKATLGRFVDSKAAFIYRASKEATEPPSQPAPSTGGRRMAANPGRSPDGFSLLRNGTYHGVEHDEQLACRCQIPPCQPKATDPPKGHGWMQNHNRKCPSEGGFDCRRPYGHPGSCSETPSECFVGGHHEGPCTTTPPKGTSESPTQWIVRQCSPDKREGYIYGDETTGIPVEVVRKFLDETAHDAAVRALVDAVDAELFDEAARDCWDRGQVNHAARLLENIAALKRTVTATGGGK